MAIRNWHAGKIILLWIWGLVLMALSLYILKYEKNLVLVLGYILITIIIGLPITLSVITWKWLSGKEDSQNLK